MELVDIVFEERNKQYGGYYLRKKYFRYLGVSFLITLSVCLLFCGYVIGYKFFSIQSVPNIKGVIYDPIYISEQQLLSPEPPLQKPEELIVPEVKTEEIIAAPAVTDSVPLQTKEQPKEPEKKEEPAKDSASGGGSFGNPNGDIDIAVERLPEFPGGENAKTAFIIRNTNSQLVKRSRVRGNVIVSFRIRRDGKIDDVKVVKSLNPEIDKECVRVISSMPNWSPAMSGGKPIDFWHNQPFVFAF